MRGIDYSWARPGGKAIREAGFEFCMRYVPYPGDSGKGLTVDEIKDLRAHGLAIGLVFESTADRHLGGRQAGIADAQRCAAAIDTLGFPKHLPVYFAVDFDTTPGQQAVIDEYQRGAASVLGAQRVGVYGSFYVVERCKASATAKWFWQTYAWSGGQQSAHNHLYQYLNGQTLNGGEVDHNEAYGEDQGLWLAQAPVSGVSRAEFDALKAIVDRIDGKGIILGPDGQGYDVRNETLNTAVHEGLNYLSALIEGHEEEHPGTTQIPDHNHGGVQR